MLTCLQYLSVSLLFFTSLLLYDTLPKQCYLPRFYIRMSVTRVSPERFHRCVNLCVTSPSVSSQCNTSVSRPSGSPCCVNSVRPLYTQSEIYRGNFNNYGGAIGKISTNYHGHYVGELQNFERIKISDVRVSQHVMLQTFEIFRCYGGFLLPYFWVIMYYICVPHTIW